MDPLAAAPVEAIVLVVLAVELGDVAVRRHLDCSILLPEMLLRAHFRRAFRLVLDLYLHACFHAVGVAIRVTYILTDVVVRFLAICVSH